MEKTDQNRCFKCLFLFVVVEKERLNDDEVDDNTISHRLKTDYLKQTGKYKSFVADGYSEVDESSIIVLRCKDHKTSITCLCVSADDKFIFSGSKDGSIVKCTYLKFFYKFFNIYQICRVDI